jgi:Zn-dependent peptidase ImmA (M78 family)
VSELVSPSEIGARIARKRAEGDIRPDDLARSMGISLEDLRRLERGEFADPPGDWILLAARKLDVDFRYLVTTELDEEEETIQRLYRSMKGPSVRDEVAIRRFLGFAVAEAELRELLGRPRLAPPPPHLAMIGAESSLGRAAAREERRRLGLGLNPIDNPFELIRNQGVTVIRHRLEDSDLAGLTVVHRRAGACVLINYGEDLYRQFFSAAHEYAHVLFDRDLLAGSGFLVSYYSARANQAEQRANAFAGEFLLPGEALRSQTPPRGRAAIHDFLLETARRYHVNTEVVLFGMARAGWLGANEVDRWRAERPKIPRREKFDPDMPPNLSRLQIERRLEAISHGLDMRFVEMIRFALVGNEISFGRAAEMLNRPVHDVRPFLGRVGAAL